MIGRFRNNRLRKIVISACLTTTVLAWQNSVADALMFDSAAHGHATIQSSDAAGQPEMVAHEAPAYHHCSSCAVHMLAIGSAFIDHAVVKNGLHHPPPNTTFKVLAEAPPTPPPNA